MDFLISSGTNNSSCSLLEVGRKASSSSFEQLLLLRELLVYVGLFVSSVLVSGVLHKYVYWNFEALMDICYIINEDI